MEWYGRRKRPARSIFFKMRGSTIADRAQAAAGPVLAFLASLNVDKAEYSIIEEHDHGTCFRTVSDLCAICRSRVRFFHGRQHQCPAWTRKPAITFITIAQCEWLNRTSRVGRVLEIGIPWSHAAVKAASRHGRDYCRTGPKPDQARSALIDRLHRKPSAAVRRRGHVKHGNRHSSRRPRPACLGPRPPKPLHSPSNSDRLLPGARPGDPLSARERQATPMIRR